jgi:hypothetical protein
MPKSRGRKRKKGDRIVKMPAPLHDALREQRQAFKAKFGREPGPGDPLIFDPDYDVPTPYSEVQMQAELIAALTKAGAPPEVIYAYRKTGLLAAGDQSCWPPDRLREWEDAIQEYFALGPVAEAAPLPDERVWSTEIPELLARPLSREEHEQVLECVRLVAPIQARGMSVAARMELAAAFLADACASAYRSADAEGKPELGPARHAFFEDLAVKRARELYAQGRA